MLSRLGSVPEKSEEKKLFTRLHELNNQIRSMDQEVTGSIITILEA